MWFVAIFDLSIKQLLLNQAWGIDDDKLIETNIKETPDLEIWGTITLNPISSVQSCLNLQ